MFINSIELDILRYVGLRHEFSFTIPATHGTTQGLCNDTAITTEIKTWF
jgi:hypothetical protein